MRYCRAISVREVIKWSFRRPSGSSSHRVSSFRWNGLLIAMAPARPHCVRDTPGLLSNASSADERGYRHDLADR